MTKRSAGYVVPASEWNQLIDNDEACAVAQFTAAGDLFTGTGSRAGSRHAIGSNYQLLSVNPANADKLGWVSALCGVDIYNTAVPYGNSNTKTTLRQFSLPANILYASGNHCVWGKGFGTYMNNPGGSRTLTLELTYASTVLSSSVTTINNDGYDYTRFLEYEWFIVGNGAANAQIGAIRALHHSGGTISAESQLTQTAGSVDSASAQNVTVSGTWSAANAKTTLTLYNQSAYVLW